MADTTGKVIARGFGIGGYLSFAQQIQWFDPLSQINIIIGENNLGKSNILRFIAQDYLRNAERPQTRSNPAMNESDLNQTIPKRTLLFGLRLAPRQLVDSFAYKVQNPDLVGKLFAALSKREGSSRFQFHLKGGNYTLDEEQLTPFLNVLTQHEWQTLARNLANDESIGNITNHAQYVIPRLLDFNNNIVKEPVIYIPAKRETNRKEGKEYAPSNADYFDGSGLGELIAKHKNPENYDEVIPLYDNMLSFVRKVTGDSSLQINVPHGQPKVQVTWNGKTWKLEQLGTGIHEVILIAAAAFFHTNRMVCIEEPEVHMHPTWQRRLIRELKNTENQYFIATHSAHIIDVPGVSVFHLTESPIGTVVKQAVSASEKSEVCASLGYKPSDLYQTNCIIWVEGPTDRIYLKHWISESCPELEEGIHYSLMFYGGSLRTYLTAEDLTEIRDGEREIVYPKQVSDLIELRRINQNLAIVMDSDRHSAADELKLVVKELQSAFDKAPGVAWVTRGRSIENYFAEEDVLAAMKKIHPDSVIAEDEGVREFRLLGALKTITPEGKERIYDAKKSRIAEHLVKDNVKPRSDLGLEEQMTKLIGFIKRANKEMFS